jgi:hypothetical protein
MKKHQFAFLLSSVTVLAQPTITPPSVGIVRDFSGGLHAMVGVPGNFVALDDGAIPGVISAAFSGSAGLVKTEQELLVLDSARHIVNRYDAPAGRALFAFDSNGAPALAYYAGALFRFDNAGLKSVNWRGPAVAIALVSPESAMAIVQRHGRLRNVRITLATGDIENETATGHVSGPLLLLPDGDLLFTRENDIVLRDSSGVERLVPAAFEVAFFEPMGRDWIAVREAAGGRLFGLRIAPQSLDLYQLPEVFQ